MNRRKFLLGLGGSSLGGGLLLESGAFDAVTAKRDVTVDVSEDPNAYLGLDQCPDSPNAEYSEVTADGRLAVELTEDSPTNVGGEGVNSDAVSTFDRVFQLRNQGTKPVCLWIEDEDGWPTYESPNGERRRIDFYLEGKEVRSLVGEEHGLTLDIGESICVGMEIDTVGLSEDDDEAIFEAIDHNITIHASASADCADVEPAAPAVDRKFKVHAIEADIVYNKAGLHQPNGAMYVLEEKLEEARKVSGVVPDAEFDFGPDSDGGADDVDTSVIEPLVIRANQGEVVEIEFTNHLDDPASMHQTGLPQDPKTSDGMNVGENPSSIAESGETVTYRWHAAHKGGHFFYDGAHQGYNSPDEEPEKANHLSRGLFGTLVVEPEGATWTDPVTGGPIRSGTKADIHDPNHMGTSYREFVPHYHSPSGVYLQDGSKKTWPKSDNEQAAHAINYRAGGTGTRSDPEIDGSTPKRYFYSSWPNGDPGSGDNVFHAYKGDSIKFVPVGASLEENHIHHVHNSRWKTVPTRTDSDTIDAQTIGLGAAYPQYLIAAHGRSQGTSVHDYEKTVRPNMDFREAFERGGAGYAHGTAGDILFHCHLFPHYAEGMWAFMRVHDKERPDLTPLPETRIVTNPVQSELPLQDGILGAGTDIPALYDALPVETGEFPPKPVSSSAGTTNPRLPTPAEKNAGLSTDVPGAPYNDPVMDDDAPVRNHTIHVLQGKQIGDVVYNDKGDYDPEGLVYVHEDDVEAAKNGELNPEPLFIRANVGEAVNMTVVNETEYPITIHPHFVGFDAVGSDSTPSVGTNSEQSVEAGEERTYRWYADEEGAIYFHDHTVGVDQAMHGTFAGLIVEPEGSRHLDPYSGEEIESGAQAIIEVPDGTDFREFALHYNDFVPLKKRENGEYVNKQVEHNENVGTQAINNRNAPYHHRDDEDPAYVHSSAVHGDPSTPLLEAYSDDPVKVRLFQGAWEDQHNFQINGRKIEPEGHDEQDTVSQIISPSEAFTFSIDPEGAGGKEDFDRMPNSAGLPVRDHMYGSGIVDDRFTGMWGIHRVFDAEAPHLESLPDRGAPDGQITADQLKEMGHSAPYLGIDRLKTLGQRARLIYEDDDDRTLTPDTAARKNSNVGEKPPKPPSPGDPCPDDAEIRSVDVTARQVDIEFNDYGDHDPHGIVFALEEYADEIEDGTRPPEPLTLRARHGECVEVTLKNELPEDYADDEHEDPPMRVKRDWDPSNRVSLHPERITYDPNGSDGATVGFNYDQTVAPGEEITYRWYADDLYDNMVLTDEADVRGHRHHGAYGNLVIEPADATWLDSTTGEVLPMGSEALIRRADADDTREYTISMSDGRYAINRDDPDWCIVPGHGAHGDEHTPCNKIGGFEDSGHGAINNRSEPFTRRFEEDDDQHKVYDSEVHGDPTTPVFRAALDDPVKFLVHQPADKARGMSFHLSGHQWQRYRGIPESPVIGVDDRISPGKGIRLGLTSDAGGHQEATGDYIFQDTKQRRRLESGLWGIFRVRSDPEDFGDPIHPLPEEAENRVPEELPGWNVVRADVTGDGTNGDLVVGVPDSDVGAKNGGAVYVFADPTGVPNLADADLALLGTEVGRTVGTTVAVSTLGEERSSVAPKKRDEPVLLVETEDGNQLSIRAATIADELADPTATSLHEFLANAARSNFGSVHDIDEFAADDANSGDDEHDVEEDVEGYRTSLDDVSEEPSGSTSSSRSESASSALGSLNVLECTDCGQTSAVTGDASRWNPVEAAKDGLALLECETCGNHEELDL